MRRLLSIIMFVASFPQRFGQCTSSYSDGDVDANGTGWTSVTDYYSSQCTPAWGSFTHDYVADIAIQSPSGRWVWGYNTSSQWGGGGTAYASTSIRIYDEMGTYYLQEANRINCSVAGLILATSVRSPFFVVGKARAEYGYDSPIGGCSYHKSCSPAMNHWAGSQYTSMDFNNPPTSRHAGTLSVSSIDSLR